MSAEVEVWNVQLHSCTCIIKYYGETVSLNVEN